MHHCETMLVNCTRDRMKDEGFAIRHARGYIGITQGLDTRILDDDEVYTHKIKENDKILHEHVRTSSILDSKLTK